MAFNIIYDHPEIVGPWVFARTGGTFCPEVSTAIGQVDSEGNLVAGCVFEGFNGAVVKGHIAIDSKNKVSRQFWCILGDYAFNHIKARKVIGLVDSTNVAAVRMDKKLGYKEEGRIVGGTVNGDLLVLTLTPEDYRFKGLTLDEVFRRI